MGLGSGITTTSGILIVSLYFERRRTIGSSICLSGNALGGFFMPPLVDHLLKAYGLRGAFLILAALQLHICAASMFFRPISVHAVVQAAELRRKDKLLPSVAASSPARFSSPSHFKTLWSRMKRHYVSVESVQETEVQHQVSFLRSASMLNSVPNLTLYARSWSVSGGPAFPDSRPSFNVGSRSSLSNNSTSKWSLTRLPMFAEHPTVMRLCSEDESIQRSSSGLMHHHGGSRRSSLPRILAGVDPRSSLTRQTSIRTAHSRIMESLQEQDKEDSEGILQSPSPDCDEKEEIEQMIKEGKDNEKLQIKEEEEQEKKENLEEEVKPNCCWECLRGLCDASLFRDGQFWVVAISVFLVACGTPFSLFYLPSYADSISISSSVTTGMLSMSSIVDLMGRLSTGVISDLHFCQLHYIYFISSLSAGSAVLILPHVTDTAALTGVLCVFGFFVGSWFVTIPAMLAAHHGASKLAASYGIVRLFNGIMNFISPQATVGMPGRGKLRVVPHRPPQRVEGVQVSVVEGKLGVFLHGQQSACARGHISEPSDHT
ncbi:Monocarboxylate transporter 12 [Portunus trituberculatus]|uniref:Monocarboxylate transporter 12 n=1 Tax=Portunus trituberculatus TaxID=210409 RepID=A0A5B7D3D8_PORTR|nr:Monocarboxylate transporter 12 [Portunus trituberculatus]